MEWHAHLCADCDDACMAAHGCEQQERDQPLHWTIFRRTMTWLGNTREDFWPGRVTWSSNTSSTVLIVALFTQRRDCEVVRAKIASLLINRLEAFADVSWR